MNLNLLDKDGLVEMFIKEDNIIINDDLRHRNFYICHKNSSIHYLLNNGEISLGIKDDKLGFWKTEEEAKSFYKDWREKAIKHLKESDD